MADSDKKPFTDSRMRLQWAKESIADFKRCADIYFKRTPRELFIEPDPDGIHERHKFRFGKPLPLTLTKHTVHAIEDLRSALDLAVVDVARLSGISVEGRHFPFSKSAGDFKSRINDVCKDFPDAVTQLITEYEPYAGGSDLLFAIKELCNTSKHRIIVPVASTVGTNFPYIEGSVMTRPIRIFEGYSSDEEEITLAITERGLKWKYKANLSFQVCFGKVGTIEGRLVGANIEAMIRAVTIIVDEIETESCRLGLLTT